MGMREQIAKALVGAVERHPSSVPRPAPPHQFTPQQWQQEMAERQAGWDAFQKMHEQFYSVHDPASGRLRGVPDTRETFTPPLTMAPPPTQWPTDAEMAAQRNWFRDLQESGR